MGPNVAVTFCRTLVDEWVALGVVEFVVSPGSRSTPLALAAASDPRIRVHVHLDERSAAFTALGVGLATGRPAVVVTTSGTAAVELHPAVVEAHQAGVPLIAATADRPPELRGTWAPQTIDQRELYGGAVRWYCEPGPPDHIDPSMWRTLATDVVDRATAGRPGPVHLDLAFREPLVGDAGEVPPRSVAGSEPIVRPVAPTWRLLDEQVARLAPLVANDRGLIVAGVRTGEDDDEVTAVLAMAEATGWPVLADASSGCRVPHLHVVAHSDPLLRLEWASSMRPTVVLRFGGLLASRVTNEWLAASGATQVGFDRHGIVPDPDGVLADTFAVSPPEAARQLAPLAGADRDRSYLEGWRRADDVAAQAIASQLDHTGTITEPGVARDLLAAVPDGASLVVSSSMPIRDLEWYAPPRRGVRVLANRGANGIDGVMSTAVGVALGSRAPTVCLIGDVAFVHDTNALAGLRDRGADLLVVVVDNDGGGIFSFLPQAEVLPEAQFEQLFGTPHGIDLAGLTRAHGLRVDPVRSGGELVAAVRSWSVDGGVRVLIAGSDRALNVEVHRELNDAVARAIGG